MLNQTWKLRESGGTLTSYILDDGEYARAGRKHPAVIVCPGGGYTYVSRNEGEPVALAFNRYGYHAFVLDYSVKIDNPFPTALQELATAIMQVRQHAEEWRIDADNIILAGFSAGGNLALSAGIYFDKPEMTSELGFMPQQVRPDAIVLGYPAVTLHPTRSAVPPEILEKIKAGLMPSFEGPSIRQILLGKLDCTEEEYESLNLLSKLHADMPPVFIWGSFEDSLIPVTDLTGLAAELSRLHVPCELHLYNHGPHGMSLADETVKDVEELAGIHLRTWFDLAIQWLKERH
ncbi:MAG: alpha/beta hydrolase [Lachnospiraceae bacterium]|jgi:acetyl esterase/lipase|nr:alpha/beta hydrolase [Lachnospiraceae bacterium]MBQ2071791.1 alpha/beta hydrolase [Oscillospiraceae bacterium]